MNNFYNFSPSQVKKYRQCPRMYYYEYKLKLRSPTSDKMQFGTDVHTLLENWLEKNILPPDNTPQGQVARMGIEKNLIPVPAPALQIEYNFKFPILPEENIWTNGKIDVLDITKKPILVLDHKTTSSTKYIMPPEELINDPQVILYSLAAMQLTEIQQIHCKWVYYIADAPKNRPRKAKSARAVELIIDPSDPVFQKNVVGILQDLKDMKKLLAGDLASAQKDLKACNDYGGCHHRAVGRCVMTDEENEADLLDRMFCG